MLKNIVKNLQGGWKMKLEIEKFISEAEFSEATMSLIEEGILCYKAGAYRGHHTCPST